MLLQFSRGDAIHGLVDRALEEGNGNRRRRVIDGCWLVRIEIAELHEPILQLGNGRIIVVLLEKRELGHDDARGCFRGLRGIERAGSWRECLCAKGNRRRRRFDDHAIRLLCHRVCAGEIVDRQRQNEERDDASARDGEYPCARGGWEDMLLRFARRQARSIQYKHLI